MLAGNDLALRLAASYAAMHGLLTRLLDEGQLVAPVALAVEGGAYGSNRRDEQQQVMGVIRLACYQLLGLTGKQLVRVPPNSAKKALTGYGLADKERMGLFARAYIADADEHAADSIGIALGALERLGLVSEAGLVTARGER